VLPRREKYGLRNRQEQGAFGYWWRPAVQKMRRSGNRIGRIKWIAALFTAAALDGQNAQIPLNDEKRPRLTPEALSSGRLI